MSDEQMNDEQINNKQISDEQKIDEQMKINDLNECFTFFIIELTSAETKRRVVKKNE